LSNATPSPTAAGPWRAIHQGLGSHGGRYRDRGSLAARPWPNKRRCALSSPASRTSRECSFTGLTIPSGARVVDLEYRRALVQLEARAGSPPQGAQLGKQRRVLVLWRQSAAPCWALTREAPCASNGRSTAPCQT
jgi:hypothetical protein